MNKLWWEQHPHWQTNAIPTRGGRGSKNSWRMFIILCCFTAFVLYNGKEDLIASYQSRNYTDMKELILVAVTFFFLVKAILDTRKARRYGHADFIMNPFPAFLGKNFSGSVELHDKVDANVMRAELLLMQRRRIAMKDHGAYRQYLEWKMPLQLSVEPALKGSRILVDGRIPDDKPPSQETVGENYYWQLFIYSRDKSYKARWDVPVLGADDYVAN